MAETKCERCLAKNAECTVFWNIYPTDSEKWGEEPLFTWNVNVCLDCAQGTFFPPDQLWPLHQKLHPSN